MLNRLFNHLIILMFLFALFPFPGFFADDHQNSWGPDIGTQITLSAPDHLGEMQTIESLRGENGLLVFFNRSADW